jgi:hypothetical protein
MDLKSVSNSAISFIHSKFVKKNFVLVIILALSTNFEAKQKKIGKGLL